MTVVATQAMVHRALGAAADLEREGISVEVIDPRTLVPLDEETILESMRRTGRLVIAHEAVRRGGFGAEIAALVAEKAIDALDAPIVRVAARNVPMPYNDALERATTRPRRTSAPPSAASSDLPPGPPRPRCDGADAAVRDGVEAEHCVPTGPRPSCWSAPSSARRRHRPIPPNTTWVEIGAEPGPGFELDETEVARSQV